MDFDVGIDAALSFETGEGAAGSGGVKGVAQEARNTCVDA